MKSYQEMTPVEREAYDRGVQAAYDGTIDNDVMPSAGLRPVEQTPSSLVWSPQQQAIFGWFSGGAGHLVVRARAGTGKTTTILEAIKHAPEQRILVAAFNKRIQEELAARNKNPNAEVKTLHGVGFACVRRYRERVQIARGNDREKKLVEAVCDNQTPDAIKKLIGKLMSKGREIAPLSTAPSDLVGLAETFECVPDESWIDAGFDVEYVASHALECMKAAADLKTGEEIDFADMIFLPVYNRWLHKMYDLGVCDEGQDMNAAQLLIFRGVCGGRMAIVGDDRQGIYAFRGADFGSLDRLKSELEAEELSLTVTRRCAKAIVRVAQQLVPDIRAFETAPEGLVSSLATADKLVEVAGPGDFILSRSNAPLAQIAMAMIRANKPVMIQGRDIGAGLKALIKKLTTGRAANSIPELLAKLVRWEEREVARVMKADRPEQAESIRDKADTVRCLCDGVAGTRELEVRIDTLFADSTSKTAVVCSSIHKSKGLEAERVFILRKTLYPKPPDGSKLSEQRLRQRMLEEQNIHYVAVTRAISNLVWVENH